MSMNITSPLTGKARVSLERQIPTRYIIESYAESYGIDVSGLLDKLESIGVYRCEDTGLRFYGPGQVAGDSPFYEKLQEFPWYYMDWKWEHQAVAKTLQSDEHLLEIGCAEGAFLQRIKEHGVKVTGLELNVEAAKTASEAGLDVHTEPVQEHALANPNTYDVVCSFQVMEHVTDVRGILEASVRALKPGGRLIISVPNNDSFIKHSPDSILNMPPHHMNLWDEESLEGLAKRFDIELLGFQREPLQEYHYNVVINQFLERRFGNSIAVKGIKKLITWTRAYKLVGLFKNSIKGHSIIAYYRKTA